MSSTDKTILEETKHYITKGDLNGLKDMWCSLQEYEFEQQPDWINIFQKIYLRACVKKHIDIANWLQHTIFPQFDPIQQIALRQVFSYGRYLLNKK